MSDDLKPKGYDEFMESILLEYAERDNKTEEVKKRDWKDEIIEGYELIKED